MTKTKKWNLFDVIVILFVLLCLLGVSLRWQARGALHREEVRVDYTVLFEISSLRHEVADCILEGDLLYTASGEVFGTLHTKEVYPAHLRMETEMGSFEGEEQDRLCDLRLFVTVRGVRTEEHFLWDGRHALLRGEAWTLYTRRATICTKVLNFYPKT